MKYTRDMLRRIEAWVSKNGLYPQPCGASVTQFCEAMGISWDTLRAWEKNPEFSELLTRARDKFDNDTVREVENALIKSAKGAEYSIIVEEAKRNENGQLVTVKAKKKVFIQAPNVEAAKFVLANMASDKWRIKQEQTINAGEGVHIHVDSVEEKDKIEKIGDIG